MVAIRASGVCCTARGMAGRRALALVTARVHALLTVLAVPCLTGRESACTKT